LFQNSEIYRFYTSLLPLIPQYSTVLSIVVLGITIVVCESSFETARTRHGFLVE